MAGGRLDQAEHRYREAAALLRQQSSSYEAADISAQVSVDLATVMMHAGRFHEAQDEFEEAFHLARKVGDVCGQSDMESSTARQKPGASWRSFPCAEPA
jgi:hypothetical protein